MALEQYHCGGVDVISQLPDALLCYILSYLPTKQCVRTSSLSKQWLRVLTNLCSIDIDDSMLMLQEPILGADHSAHTSFIRFMSSVFDRATILKFTLKCSKFDLFTVRSWILSAVTRKLRELDLCITIEKRFRMNCGSLFAYKELFSLKLGKKFVLKVPDTFRCQGLKKLHLSEVEFDDDSIHKFLSGCPVLEDLHMEMCSSKRWNTLTVNGPALKVLTFKTFDDTSGEAYDDGNYKFVLECPNLEKLNYSASSVAIKGYCFDNLHSLYEARIDVGSSETILEHEKTAYRYRAAEIARGISRAKIIHLTDYTLEIFSLMDVGDLPIFHNLIELRLGVSEHCSGELFSQLLHNSPSNLEHLVLDTDLALKGDANLFKWDWPDDVPECFSQHLKCVKIWGFPVQETSVVGEFIKYVMQNAKVREGCFASPYRSNPEDQNLDEVKINWDLLDYL